MVRMGRGAGEAKRSFGLGAAAGVGCCAGSERFGGRDMLVIEGMIGRIRLRRTDCASHLCRNLRLEGATGTAVAGQCPKTDGDCDCARRVMMAAIAVATARWPRMTLVA